MTVTEPSTDPSSPVAAKKQVVARFVAALGDGDTAALTALLHPDATWWLPGRLPVSGRYEGRDAVMDGFLAQGLGLYAPGTLRFEITRMIGEGDEVAVEWVARGRSAAGREYHNFYNVVFTVRDDVVHEVREYCDTLYVHDVLYA